MRVCPSCGFENSDDARFCAQCGGALAEPPPETQPEPAPVPVPPPGLGPTVPARSGKVDPTLKVLIIIGTILFPILGIIMGAIYMADPSPEKKAVGRLWLWLGIGMTVLGVICVCASRMSGTSSY